MTSIRSNSLDQIKIPGWQWQIFLDYATKVLSEFELEPYPVPRQFLEAEGKAGSKSKPFKVQTATWACKTSKLRQVRIACVEAGLSASVMNLLINPLPVFELPFFGVDFVRLPSGYLLALDLQPVLKSDYLHRQLVWESLEPLYQKWKEFLPSGGPIPLEAEQFFSSGFLWTRLPLGEDTDHFINDVIFSAYKDYFDLYLDLVRKADTVSEERSILLLEGQRKYITYRSDKDPARGMLSRFYGKEWTEIYLKEVLFDL